MASLASNACNASAKMLINHGKEGNLVQYLDKETILALANELKKAAKPPKKSQKKSTERADAPFNPDRCSARLYSLACHPCGSGNLYKNKKSEGQEFHYGLLNVQCNRNITQGTFRDCSTGIVCRVRISQHGIQRNRLILRTLLCLGSTSSFSDGTTYTDARLSRTCCVMIRATVRLNTTRLNRARRVQCFRVPVYENNIRLVFLYE